ncbi:MAG: hypothetical protein J1E63_00805 [Muribaculaceae bacterium]|nr:hypothetical protein [Muribaculaceae bacterium]
MKKKVNVIAIIIGIVFIISSFSKAISFNYFTSLVNNYCTFCTDIIAMTIIVTELTLGIMMLFGISLRLTSIVSFFLILLFTLIYTYGLSFIGIRDCGCFGKVHFLNSSPVLLYVRNSLFLLGLYYVYKTEWNTPQLSKIQISNYIATIIVIVTAIYLCGRTNNSALNSIDIINNKIAYKHHALNNYIKVSADSTYLIYVFSYDCPHCINSFGNLAQYNNQKYINKVIGLCRDNIEAKEKFFDFFKPSFEIKELPEEDFYNITDEYPIAFFVKNDSIIKIIKGEIPSAFFLNY